MNNVEIIVSLLKRRRNILDAYISDCKDDHKNYACREVNQINKIITDVELNYSKTSTEGFFFENGMG